MIVAVLLILLGIVLHFLRPRARVSIAESPSASAPATRGPAAALPVSGTSTTAPAANATTVVAPTSTALAVEQLAMTFTERYGSYSTEGNYVNLEDLYSLMTERYQRTTEADVAWMRASRAASGSVPAVTTFVVHVSAHLSEGEASTTATADVVTQRTTIRSGARPQTTTETLNLEIRKTPDGWRVESAKWT